MSCSLSEESEELSDVCCFDFLFFGGAASSSSSESLEELADDEESELSLSLELSDSLSEDELESVEESESEDPEEEESDSLSELDEEPLEEPDDECLRFCFFFNATAPSALLATSPFVCNCAVFSWTFLFNCFVREVRCTYLRFSLHSYDQCPNSKHFWQRTPLGKAAAILAFLQNK